MASSVGVASLFSMSTSSSEVKHLAERLNAAQVKIKRLNRLEAALVDFFMEVMDRSTVSTASNNSSVGAPEGCGSNSTGSYLAGSSSGDLQDSAYARQKRKEQFLRKADGDPISLLNALRTHLRIQFAAQSEEQQSLSSTLSSVVSRKEIQERDAKDEVRRLEASGEALRERIGVLVTQVSTNERERKWLDRQYKCCLEQMNGELHRLRAEDQTRQQRSQVQQQAVETLKQSCEALVKDKKKLIEELQCATITANGNSAVTGPTNSVASPISTQNGSNTDLVGSTPAENQNLRRALREYEVKLSKLEAANDEWKREHQRLTQQLAGFRHNTQGQAVGKLEKEFRKTRAQADELKVRVGESDVELLRTKAALKERDTRIQQMKDEYNKLFNALQKIKMHGSSSASSGASTAKLTRLSSVTMLGGGSTNKLKPTASTSSLLATSSGATAAIAKPTNNGAGTIDAMKLAANDNPYLLEHYRARMELLEKEIEGFKVQIRKMIASEYRYKQKNRLFRLEKAQLMDTCDRLRMELDKAVLSSAKAITNVQKQQHQQVALSTVSYNGGSSKSLSDCSSSPTARMILKRHGDPATAGGNGVSGSAVSEVKKLRQRNQFLEERFRAIVASADTTTTSKKDSRSKEPGNAGAGGGSTSQQQSASLRLKSAGATLSHSKLHTNPEEFENGFEDDEDDDEGDGSGAKSSEHDEDDDSAVMDNQERSLQSNTQRLRRQSSIMAIRSVAEPTTTTSQSPPTPAAIAPAMVSMSTSDSFRSLDSSTLQALHQVKTKARVRPQSASTTSHATAQSINRPISQPFDRAPACSDKMVDDVDPEQHERVAKALEQVNGLKYRYYASPNEAKKVLNFHSDDEDDEDDEHSHQGHSRPRANSKATGEGNDGCGDDNDDEDDDSDADLTFDDHIDRILRKTRTIALLKIANNTAEILPEDDDFDDADDDEDAFEYDAFDADDDEIDSNETDDRFNNDDDELRLPSQQKSFRRGNSMRSTSTIHSSSSHFSKGNSGGSGGWQQS